ncbi:unnamed protein product [Linum tenue]|uniref:Neprosin activation peptide domain-containing protein n=1 Tax=Linum tenue TaxID=586396 RepID=A0AAV0HAU4_9ROSI|nr:unnamed protein product [Linum tenue]
MVLVVQYVLLLELNLITAQRLFGRSRKQLSCLDKSVATIQTIHGDTYNCVHFYKQPAFNHPLLKNRKFDYQLNSSLHDSKQEQLTQAHLGANTWTYG